jgi:hypothetical protein
MKIMYAVMANSDTCEGRGPMYPVCLVEDRKLAEQIVVSKEFGREYGVMGTPGGKENVQEFNVVGSKEEFERMARERFSERTRQ